MKYLYTGGPQGGFFQGLPARDLDDGELTDEQRELLKLAMAQGLYREQNDELRKAPRRKTVEKEPDDGG